jgi:hypothetical protein
MQLFKDSSKSVNHEYTVAFNTRTGLNCFEFYPEDRPEIRCKFYDKIIYNIECSNLTSLHGSHLESIFNCDNKGIEYML